LSQGNRLRYFNFYYRIGGNIFSALCYPSKQLSVGASTSIFGLIATIVALLVVNWKALESQPEVRCYLIIVVVFVLLFSLLLSVNSSDPTDILSYASVDIYGHLGGLITGFFFACIVMSRFRGAEAFRAGSYENKVKIFGMGGSAFCFILFFTLFFALKNNIRC
jgi:membrane associated rhomboid family serine protease